MKNIYLLFVLIMISQTAFAKDNVQEKLRGYLSSLASMPTVTENKEENRRALNWVEEQLSSMGLFIQRYEFNGHPSLVVTTKKTLSPDIFLVAHMDVVPADNSLFVPRMIDNKMYGRGVYDMKMAIACYMLLFQELKNQRSNMNIGMMLTSDEEVGGMNGVKRLLEEGYSAKVAFLPDGGFDWNFEESAKGVMQIKIAAKGKSAHSSRPWQGENAIELLLSALGQIRDDFEKEKEKFDSYFPTANIGVIQGGKGVNQVADFAEAKLDIRYPCSVNKEKIFANLKKYIEKDSRLSLEIMAEGSPHKVDLTKSPFVLFQDIAKELYGIEIGKVASHGSSDARFFGEKNIPVLVIAPRGGEIHGDKEWIDLTDLTRFYYVLKEWLLTLDCNQGLRSST